MVALLTDDNLPKGFLGSYSSPDKNVFIQQNVNMTYESCPEVGVPNVARCDQ
jgi:hypothetical protein